MNRIRVMKSRLLAAGLGVGLLIGSWPVCGMSVISEARGGADQAKQPERGAEGTELPEDDVIEINGPEDFRKLEEACRYDSYSLGRTVRLNTDLDLSGTEFEGIASFNGRFEGNGHKITGVDLRVKGSDYGFFRYVGELGEIRDLSVSGIVEPSGSQNNIGGLAGVNYGTITGCSFEGRVEGLASVGAIAGINKTTGSIVSCSSNAAVFATNDTGGIVGVNEGFVDGCTSSSSVNTEELEPTLDLAGVDLGTLNLTQNVVNRYNIGGIAGRSTGLISNCSNAGTVGYQHSGYNAGGIVGNQSGIVNGCENTGAIYGRKDVGGIAGQAQPYVESEYLEDKVRQTQEDLDRLGNTLNQISSTISSTSAEVRRYTDELDRQYADSMDHLDRNLDTLTSAAAGNPDAQGYVDNINAARNRINEIYAAGTAPSEEQLEEVKRQLETIHSNVGNLQGTYAGEVQSPEELTRSIAGEIESRGENNRTQDIRNFVDTVDGGIQSVVSNMRRAVNQMNQITDSVSDDLAILTGDEEIITDISSLETAEQLNGVIRDCVNYGEIRGDLNVGGIAGTMNVEYEGDPEFDLRFSDSVNIRLRSTVNDVVIHCENYGAVTVKRNYAGGIAGLQEFGFVYGCESYGDIRSEEGNYLGGIAGESEGTVEKSYSLCNLEGTDYVGGICGNGYTIRECVSAVDIESGGERVGSIAGNLESEGSASGNRFVSEELHGIDNISYAGAADRVTYEEIMASEDIPDGFRYVDVTFVLEDQVIGTVSVPYGGTIQEADFPEVPKKEGCYVSWDLPEGYTDIRRNMTLTAEYIPWKESIAGGQTTAEGKQIFLAVSEFYEESGLVLTETEGPEASDETGVPAYAYSWELTDMRGKEVPSVEGHFVIPQTEGTARLWIRQDGVWTSAEAVQDGSYLVAKLPYGADFAVTVQPAEDYGYLLVCAGLLAVLLLILVIGVYRRYRRKG